MLDQVTSTNGLTTTVTYDLKGQVTSVVNKVWTNVVSEYSYVYDARGNMIESYDNGVKLSFTYDANNQITSYKTTDLKEEYTYDKIGNRTSKTTNGDKTTYNYENDLLVSTEGYENNRYVYNDSGNLTQVIGEEITSLSYNQFNQLVGVEKSNGSSMVLSYDGFGNLISTTQTSRNQEIELINELLNELKPDDIPEFKTVNIEQYENEYNNTYLHQVIKTINDTGYTYEEIKTYEPVIESYTYINDITKQYPDILVKIDNIYLTAENTIYGNNQLQSGDVNYQYDGLGNITTYTANNDTQTVTYDPFGNTESDVSKEFGYNSEYNVTEDLQYLRARYYNPETGRFITQDTVYGNVYNAKSQNRYTYTQNNPIFYDDPSGNYIITNTISMITYAEEALDSLIAEDYAKGFTQLMRCFTTWVVPGDMMLKRIFNDTELIDDLQLAKASAGARKIDVNNVESSSSGGSSGSSSSSGSSGSSSSDGSSGSSSSSGSTETKDEQQYEPSPPVVTYCVEVYYTSYVVYSYSSSNGMEYV